MSAEHNPPYQGGLSILRSIQQDLTEITGNELSVKAALASTPSSSVRVFDETIQAYQLGFVSNPSSSIYVTISRISARIRFRSS
jgi:hypothetical protein